MAAQICDFVNKKICASLFKKSFSISGTVLKPGQEGDQMIKYALNDCADDSACQARRAHETWHFTATKGA
ncbi:hypothetical protein D3Z38_12435 [Clostridiales bacterium]|nr:hypothetical protein [Clostridiales bacterium]